MSGVIMLLQVVAAVTPPQGPASSAVQAPTIGDTVWLERSVALPAGISVRPRPIPASALLEPLAPPQVVVGERGATVRYPVVLWRPGSHVVELPGPILVRPDGWSDTLGPARVRVEIGSVLPDAPPDSIPPRAAADPVFRVERSLLPAVILFGLGILLLLPIHLWWRRRGQPAPASLVPRDPLPAHALDAWLAAGEVRAALASWSLRLRAAGAERNGALDLLERLNRACYGPLDATGAVRLVEEARAWLSQAEGALSPTAREERRSGTGERGPIKP